MNVAEPYVGAFEVLQIDALIVNVDLDETQNVPPKFGRMVVSSTSKCKRLRHAQLKHAE